MCRVAMAEPAAVPAHWLRIEVTIAATTFMGVAFATASPKFAYPVISVITVHAPTGKSLPTDGRLSASLPGSTVFAAWAYDSNATAICTSASYTSPQSLSAYADFCNEF